MVHLQLSQPRNLAMLHAIFVWSPWMSLICGMSFSRRSTQPSPRHLFARDGPQLSRSNSPAGYSANRFFHGAPDGSFCRHPISNLIGDDLDDRHTRIVYISFMNAILQITKVSRDTVTNDSVRELAGAVSGTTY